MPRIRCAIYDRVSTELQAKEGLSLDAQKEALTDYAVSHGYEIVDYYADEGLTARKKMQNRKDLMRLLRDVEADKVDLILVTKLDRWFRNIKDYHNTQAILEAHNCNWKTIFEEYDTSTANGRFAINIMLSVNENECDRTSDRINSIFQYKKGRKEHLNGRPAYGYAADKDKKLIKDPATEHIVNDIFEQYFTTYSKKATVHYILSKYAGSPVCPTMYQVNRILKCSTYAGQMYGIEDYCPAYITMDQYRKIQSVSDAKIIPHQTEPFLFSSMVKCPVCGKNMNGFVKRQRLKSGEISEYKRYLLRRQVHRIPQWGLPVRIRHRGVPPDPCGRENQYGHPGSVQEEEAADGEAGHVRGHPCRDGPPEYHVPKRENQRILLR